MFYEDLINKINKFKYKNIIKKFKIFILIYRLEKLFVTYEVFLNQNLIEN